MSKIRLSTVLPKKIKDLTGLAISILNSKGEQLISRELKERRQDFKINKKHFIQKSRKEVLTIQILDQNGAHANFTSGQKQFDLDSNEQTFTCELKKNSKRNKQKINIDGEIIEPIDLTPPTLESDIPTTILEGSDAGMLLLSLAATDDGSERVRYKLRGPDASTFSVDSKTGDVVVRQNIDFESKPSYNFSVVASDLSNNSAVQNVILKVIDTNDSGEFINLSVERDIYDESRGKIVNNLDPSISIINPLLIDRPEHFTELDEIINAEVNTFGQGDSLIDPSKKDNDIITIKTNSSHNAQSTFSPVNNNTVINIETLVVEGEQDNSFQFSLADFNSLRKLVLRGSFARDLMITNYLDSAKVSEFDFSGSTNDSIGFILDPQKNNSTRSRGYISILGSPGSDQFFAGSDEMILYAGDGDDTIRGADGKHDYIAGEGDADQIDIFEVNHKTDTILLQLNSSSETADLITGFLGFDNPANKGFQHDILEINSSFFTNYTPNHSVHSITKKEIKLAIDFNEQLEIKNKVVVDRSDRIDKIDLTSFAGNGMLAFANDTGQIFYSHSGDFGTDKILTASVDDANNFSATHNISVI